MDDVGIWEPWQTHEILTDATGPYIRSIMLGLCGVWARVDEISHYTQWIQVHAAVIYPQPTYMARTTV